MFKNFMSALKSAVSNDQAESRRTHPRRGNDLCVAVVDGKTYPVENWSFGGVLLAGDDRLFGKGQHLNFTLKFKVEDKILDVPHVGNVVRKGAHQVAIQFEPINQNIRRFFQRVVDDAVAREFANSQV